MRLRYIIPMALLAITSTATSPASAQNLPESNLPNGGFEEWVDGLPYGWGGVNIPGYESINKYEEPRSGGLAVHGVTLPMPFGEGTMPCMIMTATQDPNDPGSFIPGFAYSAKPSSLTGYIKTDLKVGDMVTVVAAFNRGEAYVGGGLLQIEANHSTWTKFTVPLQYSEDEWPDTAVVTIMMGNTTVEAGSRFWLDDLSFSNEVADVEYANRAASLEVVYGGNRYIQATFHNTNAVLTKLEVVDVNGRVVETLHDGIAGSSSVRWETSSVPSGVYLIKLTRPTGVVTKKVFVAR
jgi:hypothetical protein